MPDNPENQPAPAPGGSFGGDGNSNGPIVAIGASEPDSFTGMVLEEIEGRIFRVRLDSSGMQVRTHLSGEAQRTYKHLKPGTRVLVDVSPYDAARGRILKRLN